MKTDEQSFSITFAGFLAVELMGFDYNGSHYSYQGEKREDAVKRLLAPSGPENASLAELHAWASAANNWKLCAERQKPK